MKLSFSVCTSIFAVASSIALIAVFSPARVSGREAPASALPIWAYPVPPETSDKALAEAPDVTLQHVEGSTAAFTKAQINDLFVVPDWFPNLHPPMPPAVATGRKPLVSPCAHCHLPNGFGRPENASVAGLPANYIMEQLKDFKSGARHSSEPHMHSINLMVDVAKGATPGDVKAGAEYFSSMKLKRWIRVVEADEVPKTRIGGGMLMRAEPAATERIGERVIEIPEDLEQTELRNFKSGFVAYVPTGSLKKGEALAQTGAGKTMACIGCHGANLKGVGDIPSIAGRSPSQMTRQIIDFQTGARNGTGAQMMKPVVANLTNADIVAVTGYLASLEP
jgi:cytochrome c553